MPLDQMRERTYGREAPGTARVADELIFSSDSHVIEPAGLWKRELPKAFQERAPEFGGGRADDVKNPGATEKTERVKEMAIDGVSGEVLYPTWGLRILSLDEPDLESACVRVYNDWLIDYCQAAPDRLVGLALLSVYDIGDAIVELERCRKAGLRGAVIWQVTHPDLPFTSGHYEPLWAAAQDLEMPVSLHILSGHGYSKNRGPDRGVLGRNTVNRKLTEAMDTLHDLIFSGVLDRHPRLKVVLAENEIGWLPFVLEQWDFYAYKSPKIARTAAPSSLHLLPSEYFHRQVYATFFNDAVGGHTLTWWEAGVPNCMWSNDFPHSNSTWPLSREVVARDLGSMPTQSRAKVLRDNVAQLYNIPMPEPVHVG